MTSNKQVSPAIRILRGERDVSARATHLEAATGKFPVTTNERKQMSTKTNFKRISLVAVAALGMGLLTSVPSNAAIVPANITLTTTAGDATTAVSDSSTGALISATWLASAITDTMTITVASKSKPTAQATFPKGWLTVIDTAGSVNSGSVIGVDSAASSRVILDSLTATAGNQARDSYTSVEVRTGASSANTYTTLKLKLHAAIDANGLAAGSYVYTVTATPGTASALLPADAKSIDVTITVAANDEVASAAYSTAVLSSNATSFVAPTPGTDSSVAVSATASSTSKAVMQVTLKSALNDSTFTAESVTVTTNIGTVGTAAGTSVGKSVTFSYAAGTPLNVFIFADGTAGTATLNVSTTSVTFPAKTVTFFSTTVATITATQAAKTIAVGVNAASTSSNPYAFAPIWAKAVDANGLTVRSNSTGAAAVYAYSSDLTVISDSGTACVYNSTASSALCPLTGLKAGTAKITLRNLGTGTTSGAILSSEITVDVATAAPASIKLAFDKAAYAPGERAFVTLTALDSAGKSVAPGTIAALLATGGITSSASFTNLYYSGATQTSLPTSTEVALAHYVKSVSPNNWANSDQPAFIIAMNMPTGGSSVSISATGGSAVASAGRVAVTATATITDSGAAALAAVQALATTVASLRTLITTLTNLVLKIQKKVRA